MTFKFQFIALLAAAYRTTFSRGEGGRAKRGRMWNAGDNVG